MEEKSWGGGNRGAGRKLAPIADRPICCEVEMGSWGARWRCRGACKRFIIKKETTA
jgi:hypothetical protein